MAQTLGAPYDVSDLIVVVDVIEEGKIGKGGTFVVVGRLAFDSLPGGLYRDMGQNVVSLWGRLRGFLVRGYWCPPNWGGATGGHQDGRRWRGLFSTAAPQSAESRLVA